MSITKLHPLNTFLKNQINTDLSIFCQDQNLKVFEVLTFQTVYFYSLFSTPFEAFKVTGFIFFQVSHWKPQS